MRPLQPGASKAEVLAAVEEHERITREVREVEFPGVPMDYVGCVWSLDGTVVARVGRLTQDPGLTAQQRAGEENQDFGWLEG